MSVNMRTILLAVLFYWKTCVLAYPSHEVVKELNDHFSVQEPQIRTLSALLRRMKQVAHQKNDPSREFDESSIRSVPVSISDAQPKTNPELTPFLFEGDILLSEKQANMILMSLEGARNYRSLSNDPDAIWTEFPIRYRIDASLENFAIGQIRKAIEYWQNHTCIRFQHVDKDPDGDFIEFFKGQGCYSTIGRFGGRQGISIGEGCERIGHALGLWHEQSRPDANNYVKVEKTFVLPSYLSDFQRRGSDEIRTLGIPYDYGSVMHYGSTAFSTDGNSKTLITLNPLYQNTIGQRERLSFYDIQIVNRAYCGDKCTNEQTNKCKNGGYAHPNKCEQCVCPTGYGGAYCEENQDPKNADCGGMMNATLDWSFLESPGYSDEGYSEDQTCNWVIHAPKERRIEVEFVDEFSFLCSNICLDYVEIKLSSDQRNTGPRQENNENQIFRFCCFDKPKESLVSESNQIAVIFRTQATQDIGFKLMFRSSNFMQLQGTSVVYIHGLWDFVTFTYA